MFCHYVKWPSTKSSPCMFHGIQFMGDAFQVRKCQICVIMRTQENHLFSKKSGNISAFNGCIKTWNLRWDIMLNSLYEYLSYHLHHSLTTKLWWANLFLNCYKNGIYWWILVVVKMQFWLFLAMQTDFGFDVILLRVSTNSHITISLILPVYMYIFHWLMLYIGLKLTTSM